MKSVWPSKPVEGAEGQPRSVRFWGSTVEEAHPGSGTGGQVRAETTRNHHDASHENLPTGAVVYFLRRRDGLIKIGRTSQFAKRLKTLELEHGPLEFLGAVDGWRVWEHEVHRAFAVEREWREWFRPSRDLWALIRCLGSPYSQRLFDLIASSRGVETHSAFARRKAHYFARFYARFTAVAP